MPSFKNGSRLDQLTEAIGELRSVSLTIVDYDNAFFACETHTREPFGENVLQMQLLNQTVNFIADCQLRSRVRDSLCSPASFSIPCSTTILLFARAWLTTRNIVTASSLPFKTASPTLLVSNW